MDSQFLDIENEKLKVFSEYDKLKHDSKYQFLISLLSFLKAIPRNRQLIVRNRLQQVLIEEQELSTRLSEVQSYGYPIVTDQIPLIPIQSPSSLTNQFKIIFQTSMYNNLFICSFF